MDSSNCHALWYNGTSDASIAMAEENPDGSWEVRGVLNRENLQPEVFHQNLFVAHLRA